MRGRPGATSNQVRQGHENPTYAADGAPQPGAEPNGRPLGQTAGARQRTARTEPHAQRQPPTSPLANPRERGAVGYSSTRAAQTSTTQPPPDKRPSVLQYFNLIGKNRPNKIPFLSLFLSLLSFY